MTIKRCISDPKSVAKIEDQKIESFEDMCLQMYGVTNVFNFRQIRRF